ncbi:MAG TPA: nucleotidyltransferase domain-containing protein [Terriglobales bacterium]|nr:nucleotidyltransferase domain-containing protein [Terriglobales bacterium]
MAESKIIPRDKLDELVRRLRDAAATNLQSVILYGSAVTGDFDPQYSDLNLLCVLRASSFAALEQIAPAVAWWHKQKQRPPLIMTREELERSADVFSIEFTDMRAHYNVLFGDDVLQPLHIPLDFHRAQVEYELREKLILLRQSLILAGGKEDQLWQILTRALPSFATLFRHALIATGERAPDSKRDSISILADRFRFDPEVFQQVLDIREHKRQAKTQNVRDIAARYLAAVEHVTAAVDLSLDSAS